MKREGRTVMYCHKVLPNGITERFRVVVASNAANEAKRNYELQGYKVTM